MTIKGKRKVNDYSLSELLLAIGYHYFYLLHVCYMYKDTFLKMGHAHILTAASG